MKYEKSKAEIVLFEETGIYMSTQLTPNQQAVLDQIKDCNKISFTGSTTFACDTHQGGGSEMFQINGYIFVFNGNATERTWTCGGFR